ncbi:hypothetical protein TRICHSKD4_2845 [Roseibium sp. TrichSKD4]|nr:hypothetical protein TRICHSKD4_2845 [Roseibium sp. TrichSKD4]
MLDFGISPSTPPPGVQALRAYNGYPALTQASRCVFGK